MDGRTKPRPGVDAQRRSIVEAATRLFADQGSAAVSISEVCRAADVSRPTFYRCFDDKQALVAWVYDLAVDRYVRDIELARPPAGTSLDEWLWSTVDGIVEAVFATPHLARFVFVEYGDPTSPARDLVNAAFERSAIAVGRALERATGHAPSQDYLESVMAATQWILFEALRDGLTDQRRSQAKVAVWQQVAAAVALSRAGQLAPA